jgi:hypothetical protein
LLPTAEPLLKSPFAEGGLEDEGKKDAPSIELGAIRFTIEVKVYLHFRGGAGGRTGEELSTD